jgi:hypothetical protein
MSMLLSDYQIELGPAVYGNPMTPLYPGELC